MEKNGKGKKMPEKCVCKNCSGFASRVRLVSGFHTNLCSSHVNEWLEYLIYDENNRNKFARYAAAENTTNVTFEITLKSLHATIDMYNLAEEWLKKKFEE